MKIFLVGGGSGGATAPLLAVAEALVALKPKVQIFLIGTQKGLETKLLVATSVPVKYLTIPAGKFRRYFSLRNVIDPFKILAGFIKSLFLIRKYQPNVVFGAGSYAQVPLMWAAFFLRVAVVIHQQDRDLLLSTKLTAPVAKAVTISFAQNREIPTFSGLFSKIPKAKIFLTGNPARADLLKGSADEARRIFGLNDSFPTILVMGGSQGALKINQILLASLPELANYVQIIHVTGGKTARKKAVSHPNYFAYNFLGPELKHAYAVADLVIARGGMSTITELSLLSKPAILVPLPKSQQFGNVEILTFLKAAVGVSEELFTPDLLLKLVRKILWNRDIQQTLKKNISQIMPRDASYQIARLIIKASEESLKYDGKSG